nr:helix-turn-helix domain-containing protein [Burkholderia metallica]
MPPIGASPLISVPRSLDGLTVPAIAARAGVTPSTIYRRWGKPRQLARP